VTQGSPDGRQADRPGAPADEYAVLVNTWWIKGFKTWMKTSAAIAASLERGLVESNLAKNMTRHS
jgi:hypothetical protein